MKENTVKVWLQGEPAPVIAGNFRWESNVGVFSYASEYLSNPFRYALDPVNLPLSRKPIKQIGLKGLFGVFRDSGPDYWGRELLKRVHGDLDEFDYLNLSGQDGVGSIAISDIKHTPLKLSEIDGILGSQTQSESNLDFTINQPTSLGGAKPKLTVEHDGELWIAKFPDRYETNYLCHNEHITLSIAEEIGFNVSETKLHQFPNGRFCLLVKRFDRSKVNAEGYSKTPFASASTVLGLTGNEMQDSSRKSYLYLAANMRRWLDKSDVGEQTIELWNRIALNALVGNYDDHSRNHGFLYSHSKERWELSPVFDVIAMPYKNNLGLSMKFHSTGSIANLDTLLQSSEDFGLSKEEAKVRLLTFASHIMDNWANRAKELNVSDEYLDNLKPAFTNAMDVIEKLKLETVNKSEFSSKPIGIGRRF